MATSNEALGKELTELSKPHESDLEAGVSVQLLLGPMLKVERLGRVNCKHRKCT